MLTSVRGLSRAPAAAHPSAPGLEGRAARVVVFMGGPFSGLVARAAGARRRASARPGRRRVEWALAVLLACAGAGCGEQLPAPDASAPPPLSGLPVELRALQRTTTALPGSDGRLLLTVADVTRGQVIVSLATRDGEAVLAPRSMSPGDVAPFRFAETPFQLALTALDTSLLGDDAASFVVSASDGGLTEPQKIERLIEAVAALQGATFLRNGDEHGAAAAAEHLRRKWRAAGGKVATAEQFIDGVASRSSLSGEPYLIALPEGRTVPAGDWFRERLAEVEAEG